jgi:bifunctional non-homologous end joining protein LigD
MLATAARQLPRDADEWTAEVKWDGMRVIAAVAAGQLRLWSRAGRDVTAAYPELGALAAASSRKTLDGEVVALVGARPDFSRLQHRMHVVSPPPGLLAAVPVTFIVFDLLRVGDRDLVASPYARRRVLLDGLGLDVPGAVQVPPAFPGDAAALLQATREQGYEGIMLKRGAARYTPGHRSRDWLKVRNVRAADVLIGGWLPGGGSRAGLPGSLLVGVPGSAGLQYAGSVGTGFTYPALRELAGLLAALGQPASPFADEVPAAAARHARWVRPALSAEVTYLERTPSGRLRQPVWRGLRSG